MNLFKVGDHVTLAENPGDRGIVIKARNLTTIPHYTVLWEEPGKAVGLWEHMLAPLPVNVDEVQHLIHAIREGDNSLAISAIRALTNLGLKEAKEIIEEFDEWKR